MGRPPGSGQKHAHAQPQPHPTRLHRYLALLPVMALLMVMPDVTMQAAHCKEPADQALLLHRIDAMSAEVADAGISLKYSKKVRHLSWYPSGSRPGAVLMHLIW